MTIEREAEISLPIIGMEDVWADVIERYKIKKDTWRKIREMSELIYGEEMAVSGIEAETAKRYALMALADEERLPSWGQNEGVGKVIETQGKIILACVETAKRLPDDEEKYLALQQMTKDLFENNLFSVYVPLDADQYVVSSPINRKGEKCEKKEEWAVVTIGNKNHIATMSESRSIGRVCFSPCIVGVPGSDKRRTVSLRGKSAENVVSGRKDRRAGVRIRYTVYEPERLPDCWIETRTKTDEKGSPLEFWVKV